MIRPLPVLLLATAVVLGMAGTAAAAGGARTAEQAGLPVALSAQLSDVELFGTAQVTGRLDPPHPGMTVDVAFLRDGKVEDRRTVTMAGDGSFGADFEVTGWGQFKAEVTWAGDADHDPATASTEERKIEAPRSLHEGSKGPWVRILEERLVELHYYLRGINERYDAKTGDAVLAFHKAQGMIRSKSASKRTWKRLTDPRRPKPRAKKPRVHVEVDQSKQVLYVVRGGEIDEIIHVSTGAGGATRDGVFHVHRKLAGFSPNHLYYPSYFDGNRAVHGWPDVPPTNASHGCVRVPYWVARHMFNLMHYGMEVRVYH